MYEDTTTTESQAHGLALQIQIDHWQSLEERATHCDTMKPLSPLEAVWLDDYRAHLKLAQ